MTTRYLFVYGTLMHSSANPMQRLLLKHSEFVGSGRIQAQLYQIDDYPGAVPSDSADDHVYGEVYRLMQTTVLNSLDDYEECSAAFPEPHEYRRETMSVALSDGRRIQAWAYLYNHPVDTGKRIAGGRFRPR